MSSIGSLTGLSNPNYGQGMEGLTTEDFTNLILTELQNQDPLAPNDTSTLLDQMSTLRSIQSNMDLSTDLAEITEQNEFIAAAGMIGKKVNGLNVDLDRVDGEVESVTRTAGGIVLNLVGGDRMPMAYLDSVK
jgi:flagellar basal-body rod modification protein FlgD